MPAPGRTRALDAAIAAALTAAAFFLRVAGLNPSSLWHDDALIALVAKARSIGDMLVIAETSPGFAFVLRGAVWLPGGTGPDGPATAPLFELAAQAVPLFAGLAVPGLLYLVAMRIGLSRWAAAVGGAMLVASPILVVYSVRVKNYTLDAVLALVLLWLACRVIAAPDDRRAWSWLAGVAVGASIFSFGLAPAAGGALGAALLASLVTRRGIVAGLAACGSYGLFGLAWLVWVVLPSTSTDLHLYWTEYFIPAEEGLEVAGAESVRLLGLLLEGLAPVPAAITAGAVLVGLGVAVVRRPVVAVLCMLPLAAAVALAAMGQVPIGTGRTDAYLYPSLALLVALAVDAVIRRGAPGSWLAAGDDSIGGGTRGASGSDRVIARGWIGAAAGVALAVGLIAAAWITVDPSYPEQDLRPLVLELENRARSDDRIIVYPSGIWAYALYSTDTIDFEPVQRAPGYWPAFLDQRVRPITPSRRQPERYEMEVADAVDGQDRVWLIASHIRGDFELIEQALVARGLREVDRSERPDAQLALWVRDD